MKLIIQVRFKLSKIAEKVFTFTLIIFHIYLFYFSANNFSTNHCSDYNSITKESSLLFQIGNEIREEITFNNIKNEKGFLISK